MREATVTRRSGTGQFEDLRNRVPQAVEGRMPARQGAGVAPYSRSGSRPPVCFGQQAAALSRQERLRCQMAGRPHGQHWIPSGIAHC